MNLEVAPGTTTLIQGPNGAGKTTLLRIASGMLAPNRGTVILDGIPSGRRWRDYHRQVGFLSAGDRGLYVRFSPESHLDYWAKLAFLPRSSRREAVQEALERFGLVDFADRRADRLSQGQRQRVRLAMTFVHKPKVLLLDEPRNSLDADGLGLLVSAVDNALAHGAAVLWCSPTDEQQPIGFDRQLVIQDGAVVPQ